MTAAPWDVTVPVDASDSSWCGVMFALDLGRRGATLHFCSVVDATEACLGGTLGAAINPGPIIAEMTEDAQQSCDLAISAARKNGIAADGKVIFGSVTPAIGRYAGEHHSSALVIGTHARSGVARVALGSVAEGLMQSSDVPIVVTHVDDIAADAGDGPITVAIDGMPADRAALGVAIELARARRRSLSIINIAQRGKAARLAAQTILDDAADIARAADVAFDLATLPGPVADTIIESAQRQRSPLIVIGASGRSDLARILFGSTAAALVERAHVPVVVVRQA